MIDLVTLLGPPTAVFFVTLFGPYVIAGTRPERYTLVPFVRFAALVAALSLLIAWISQSFGPPLSLYLPWAGAGGLVLLLLVAARAMLGQSRITHIRRGLDDPTRAAAALAELEALRAGLADSSPTEVDRVNVASLLIHAARPVEAIEILSGVGGGPKQSTAADSTGEPKIDPVVQALRETIEISALIQLGRRREARDVLSRMRRPAPRAVEISAILLEALLDALERKPMEALARLDAIDPKKSRELHQYMGVVRAHALAASNEHEEARALLLELRESVGDLVLQKIVAHEGPASRFAKKILDGDAG